MNLIGDPWIPVVYESGEVKTESLDRFYQKAHQIRDLVVKPPERVALMRFLLCVTQAGLDGPADAAEWTGCRNEIQAKSLEYLEKWKDRFDLYGTKPLLQVPTLKRTDNATVDKLDFCLAAGNNATLFDHEASSDGRKHSAGWCAVKLITYQCFSPGGLIGQTQWNGENTGRTSEHAPCVESSMLHLILRGPTLLDTMHLNLITKSQLEKLPSSSWGRPIWETLMPSPYSQEAESHSASFLGRLVPLSRAILLNPDRRRLTLANGVSFLRLPEWREPSGTVIPRGVGSKTEDRYLSVDLARHPWRELGSVLASDESYRGGALPLEHLVHLKNQRETVDIWTGGLAADRGKILDVAEWSFCIPTVLLGEAQLDFYRSGAEEANMGAYSVSRAVNEYFSVLKVDPKVRPKQKAKSQYWRELDRKYDLLIEAATKLDSDLRKQWSSVIQLTGRKVYSATCPKETPRQIQAFAQGERGLRDIRRSKNS